MNGLPGASVAELLLAYGWARKPCSPKANKFGDKFSASCLSQ